MIDFVRLSPSKALSDEYVLEICKQVDNETCRSRISPISYLGIRVACGNVHEVKTEQRREQEVMELVSAVSNIVEDENIESDAVHAISDDESESDNVKQSVSGVTEVDQKHSKTNYVVNTSDGESKCDIVTKTVPGFTELDLESSISHTAEDISDFVSDAVNETIDDESERNLVKKTIPVFSEGYLKHARLCPTGSICEFGNEHRPENKSNFTPRVTHVGGTVQIYSEEVADSSCESDTESLSSSGIIVNKLKPKDGTDEEDVGGCFETPVRDKRVRFENVQTAEAKPEREDDTPKTQRRKRHENFFKRTLRYTLRRKSKMCTDSNSGDRETNTPVACSGETLSANPNRDDIVEDKLTTEEDEILMIYPLNSVIRDRLIQAKQKPKKKFKLTQLLSCTRA